MSFEFQDLLSPIDDEFNFDLFHKTNSNEHTSDMFNRHELS